MSDHTKEPWPCFEDIATQMHPVNDVQAAIISPEDYIRARACVNACAEIPSEKIKDKTIAEYVASESYLTGKGFHFGSSNIGLNGLACQMLASAFADQFVGSGAVNFISLDMHHDELGPFTVTIQRADAVTPSSKLKELKTERDRLSALNDELTDTLSSIINDLPSNRDWLDPAIEERAKSIIAKTKDHSNG